MTPYPMDRHEREALDRWLTTDPRDTADEEIAGGMMEWTPGTLSDPVIDRIATDALADAWNNAGRKAPEFQQRLEKIIYAATGTRMTVYSGPRARTEGSND